MEQKTRPDPQRTGGAGVAPRRLPGPLVRLASGLDRLARGLEFLAMVLSALSIVAITLIVCAEVVLRTGFGISTLVSAEFAGYLLAANVYLGLAWTFRDGGFIRVELVHSVLGNRAVAVLNLVTAVVALVCFAIYTWYLTGFVSQGIRSGATSIFITRTPLWMPQLVMPIGAALMTWALLATAVRAAFALTDPDAHRKAANIAGEAGVL